MPGMYAPRPPASAGETGCLENVARRAAIVRNRATPVASRILNFVTQHYCSARTQARQAITIPRLPDEHEPSRSSSLCLPLLTSAFS